MTTSHTDLMALIWIHLTPALRICRSRRKTNRRIFKWWEESSKVELWGHQLLLRTWWHLSINRSFKIRKMATLISKSKRITWSKIMASQTKWLESPPAQACNLKVLQTWLTWSKLKVITSNRQAAQDILRIRLAM